MPLPAPPVADNTKLTLTPGIGLLFASRTSTDGGAATAVLTVADCAVTLAAAICVALPTVADALNVTVLSPAMVAVTLLLFVPAAAPSVHDVSVATPALLVLTVLPDAGLVDPPPAATANVTAMPAPTGLLNWSRTTTDGGALTPPFAAADCEVTLLAIRLFAAPGKAFAVKARGLPARPDTAAVTVFAPVVVPRVQDASVATPAASLVTVPPEAGLVAPPPDVTVNVTAMPLTGLLCASRTTTDGDATDAFTVPLCVVTLFATIFCAAPAVAEAVNDTVAPFSGPPLTVALSVLLLVPAVVPSVHELSAAMPEAPVTTVAPVGEEIEPAPAVTAKTTLTPETGLEFASRTTTLGATAVAVLTVAICALPPLTERLPADPDVPVAENVTGLPASPVAVAVREFAPAVPPNVQAVNAATPDAFVGTVAGLAGAVDPPPLATAKPTFTLATGLPSASVTMTEGAVETAVPAVALCEVVEVAAICVAVPAVTVTPAVAVPTPETVNVTVRAPARPAIARLVKVATPLAFVRTVEVPISDPPPAVIAADTATLAWLTLLPLASCS